MSADTDPIRRLVLELARLPGIGERSAARLAHFIIARSVREPSASLARDLAAALVQVADEIGLCRTCRNFTAGERCRLCTDPRRDDRTLCVVQGAADVQAIEHSGVFFGRYHVLHGALAPLEGIGPEELDIAGLVARVKGGDYDEIILATNTDVEGDATALYLAAELEPFGPRVTRLASGVPLGGELEYLDRATVARALSERREI